MPKFSVGLAIWRIDETFAFCGMFSTYLLSASSYTSFRSVSYLICFSVHLEEASGVRDKELVCQIRKGYLQYLKLIHFE